MTAIHSEGKCVFCGKTFEKGKINSHLNAHIKEKGIKNKTGKSFHIHIEAAEMFLNLWVDGKAKIDDIDILLRDIWLECCGHMSSFVDPKAKSNKRQTVNFMNFDDYKIPGEIKKNEKAENVLSKGMTLDYEYDFGSSTYLKIKVIEEFPFIADDKVMLLSRNEPLEILCEICKKEIAVQICSVCIGNEEGMFCKECAKTHKKKCEDFGDYAKMPVVNSPRMGTCGYMGGVIDKERDGVFKRKK